MAFLLALVGGGGWALCGIGHGVAAALTISPVLLIYGIAFGLGALFEKKSTQSPCLCRCHAS